ncbi:MAG: MBL fold metallo-hydrolase [Gemmatimonadales bacterium]|jgi:glyoxylase-like metal-dependent hydrolase (beta-lactamase superfamily II)|nr:MBL fold metallo-hydrolase [Gemmatimonadales bacterium]MDG2238860.1 MBL fold metallo-hydrolase [Longimicrobiales bacterium]NCG31957.1 MBL fold metallo-hydrolase [Pseudomonadota bacterium]MBT3499114.1 MBL fold metallo-hydrolase [Gemmatimonadales bacterium]MBT3774258.1 MBL fold metallo-hydrolase [Gemmatimonadales bacterium]
MGQPTCIDLNHLELEGAIACYLVDAEEPTIVDPGPTTCLELLVDELAARGVGPKDLQHVLLTHIHLDHAGACGHLVDIFPNATVHVHEDGASYMVDPERLVSSTRRTFGDAHDRLWGEMKGVPADRITAWSPGDAGPWAGIRTISTPGHIAHHVAYLDERDGTLFAGDSMGIVLAGGPTHPATPPPAVDLRAWEGTLEEIGMIGPERFGATHFGMHEGVDVRREQMRSRLAALEARVRVALAEDDTSDAERFNDEVMEELAPYMGEDRVRRYFDMFSAATDWAGVAFYLKRNP